jgi:predicted AAA+ superfamily ATPase
MPERRVLIGNQIDNQPHRRDTASVIRRNLEPHLRRLARKFPVVTLTGPRQSGKTTLCRAAFPDLPYASLEAPDVRETYLRSARFSPIIGRARSSTSAVHTRSASHIQASRCAPAAGAPS